MFEASLLLVSDQQDGPIMIQLLSSGEYLIFVLLIIALVSSLIFHELGHAVVAKWFGDDTAERAGRVTAEPSCAYRSCWLAHGRCRRFWFRQARANESCDFYQPSRGSLGRRSGSDDELIAGADLLDSLPADV